MSGQWDFVIVITLIFLAPSVIRFVRTDHVWIYKHFKKPVQTMGIIDWVECVNIPQGGCYYITTYTYTDNMGEQRTVTFKWHQRIGWPGDSIVMYFDSQSPEKCVAHCQLEYGRKIWSITLIIVLALAVFAVLGFLHFFNN